MLSLRVLKGGYHGDSEVAQTESCSYSVVKPEWDENSRLFSVAGGTWSRVKLFDRPVPVHSCNLSSCLTVNKDGKKVAARFSQPDVDTQPLKLRLLTWLKSPKHLWAGPESFCRGQSSDRRVYNNRRFYFLRCVLILNICVKMIQYKKSCSKISFLKP